MVGTVDCSEISPDPEADECIACLGLSLALERKAKIDRAVEMFEKLEMAAQADAGQGEVIFFLRERIVEREQPAIREHIDAPFVAFPIGRQPAEQRWTAKFERAKGSVLAEDLGREVAACGTKAAAAKLLRVDQGIAGQLSLDFGEKFEALRQFASVRQVPAQVDEVSIRAEAAVLELRIVAADS